MSRQNVWSKKAGGITAGGLTPNKTQAVTIKIVKLWIAENDKRNQYHNVAEIGMRSWICELISAATKYVPIARALYLEIRRQRLELREFGSSYFLAKEKVYVSKMTL